MAMRHFWEEEITPEEKDKILDKTATEIVRRGLAAPAVFALEAHKPLCNVMAHTALAFSGFIAPFMAPDLFDKFTRLMSERENVEELIVLIESKASEAKA